MREKCALVFAMVCVAAPVWADATDPVAAVLEKTNEQRVKLGLAPLTENLELKKAAQAHAEDMAAQDYLSDKGKDGRTVAQRVVAAGYQRPAVVVQNTARGQKTAAQVVNHWMHSKSHRENILRPAAKELGVGMAEKGDKRYWVQVFASPAKPAQPGKTNTPGKSKTPAVAPTAPALPRQAILPDVPAIALPERLLLDGFEKGHYIRWKLDGDCWGNAPEDARYGGARFRGWSGSYYASSAHPDKSNSFIGSGKGTALSPEFPITHTQLRFRIGGGNYPGECALNLLVKDDDTVTSDENGKEVRTPGVERIVRTQTGYGTDRLVETSWDLGELVGKRARLQMVDERAFGSQAYIMVDDLELAGLPPDLGVAMAPEPIRTGPVMIIEGKLPRPAPPKAIATIAAATSVTSATLKVLPSQNITLPDGTMVRGKSLILKATGYGPGENGPWGDRTFLGTKVGYGTVAVDPKVIPLRTRLWVEGYGFCVAMDTGGAIKGMRIDLGFNDDITANQYDPKNIKVIVLD